jgi:class 3 adenylate cyclase
VQCPRCQAENRDGARFCRECGTTFGAVCSGCGARVEAGSKFCDSCGAPLAATPAQPTAPRRFASPESYTPKHLADKILTSKVALEGERKQVTVLFADLKGSMELLADRDPEEARKLLDPVLERMMEAVHRYEGTVNQVMGDGIMALFGAPVAHEDHAVRACYAALRMQDAVDRHAESLPRGGGRPLAIRLGLNSGEVVVRSIGSDLRMDYTAVGATTHLSARMEQLATPGSILMTAATYALAEGYVQVHARGPTTVKGLAEPVSVYELTGASGLRTRFQTSLSRGLSRFVGRDAALAELRSALVRAAGGHGQVVAMLGEPGVGKSRLLYEFVHGTGTRDWLILEGRAFSYAQATPYLPLIDVLKAYFQIEDRDDATKIGDKVAGKLVLDEAAETLLSPILALLDAPVGDASWVALDPRERRQRTLDACRHLFMRESRIQPVLVILEDLHWVDSETQALLDALVETLAGARILLIVNYRPEYRHGWGSKTYYRQVQLAPLPREHAEVLLTLLIGSDPSLAPLTALLIEQTEGNPLFLEECVRSLVESNTVVGERGAYRLAADASRLRVPATVHAILAARIDRLAPEDKALLQAAAVIGKKVPWTSLLAIAGLGEAELRAGPARLQSAEFIVEGQLFPDLEYAFRHALTHDVAYASLLQERRCTLHGQVVAAMERLYGHRLTEHAEALGHHAILGQRWKEAVAYLRLAADKARRRSAHRQAITYLEQALAALPHLPESRARDEQAVDVRIDLRQSFYLLGDTARNTVVVAEARNTWPRRSATRGGSRGSPSISVRTSGSSETSPTLAGVTGARGRSPRRATTWDFAPARPTTSASAPT